MNRLAKYFVIVYSILAFLLILLVAFDASYDNFLENYTYETTYDSEGNQMVKDIPRNTISYYLLLASIFLLFYIYPLFIIILSALYSYREKQGYLKSLSIPASYAVLGFVLSWIWLVYFSVGEEGMAIIFIWPQLVITLIVSAIVNWIVLAKVCSEK